MLSTKKENERRREKRAMRKIAKDSFDQALLDLYRLLEARRTVQRATGETFDPILEPYLVQCIAKEKALVSL